MATILLPSRRLIQPSGRVDIDPSPLGFTRPRDLFAFHEGRFRDVYDKYSLSLTGTPAISNAGGEIAARFPGAADKLITSGNLSTYGTGTCKAVLLRVRPRQLNLTYEYVLSTSGMSLPLRHYSIGGNWGYYDGSVRDSGNALVADRWATLLIAHDGSTSARFYRDGSYLTSTVANSVYWGGSALFINEYLSGGNLGSVCDISLVAFFDRYVPDGFCREITRNPWQLFRASRRARAMGGVSGGGTTITLSDSGAGADALDGIAVSLGLADSGVGVDDAPGAAAALSLADSGAGSDALTLSALLAVADAGAGADVLTLAVAVQLADSGAGADLVDVLTGQLISLADAGSGSDLISAVTVSLALADAGAGADATVIQAVLQLADSGSGADAISILTATLIQILDAGTGADGLSVAVAVPVSDAGVGADLLAIQALISLVESATGADAVLRFDSAARIFTITFTLTQRRAEFAFSTRTATFQLN